MIKIVYGVAALVAVLVIGVFVAPYLIDWNDLKPTIAERAEQQLGRKLAIDGELDVQFLPVPRISVRDVRLASLPGANAADMARAKRLDLELALGALIGGRIEVVNLALIDPVIELERLADGRVNWQFEPKPESSSAVDQAAEPAAADDDGRISTERLLALELRDGALTFRDAKTGRVEHVHGVDAAVTAQQEGGPYRAKGSLTLRETPIEFEGTLGRGAMNAPTPFSFGVRLDGEQSKASFQGTVVRTEERVEGTLAVDGANLETTLASLGIAPGDVRVDLAQPFTLSSAVTRDAARLNLKQLQLRLGDTTASGALAYVDGTPAQVDLVLALNRVDLDALNARRSEPPRSSDAGSKPEPDTTAGAAQAEATAPGGADGLPADMTASINLTVEAVQYRAQVIRAVQAILSLEKGVLTVRQASAALPGGADASLVGRLSQGKAGLGFDGSLDVRADDVRALASWLGADLSGVPAERLRRFSMKADVKASEAEVLVPKLNAKLDASTLSGSAAIVSLNGKAKGARPQITANLALDRLQLDAYMTSAKQSAATTQADESDKAATANEGKTKAANKESEPSGMLLAGYDLAGTLRIAKLSYRGLSFNNVELNPLWRDEILKIGEFTVAEAAGLAITASGEGRALDSATPQLIAHIEASAASLGPVARALELGASVRLENLGRSTLRLDLAGHLDKFALDGALDSEAGRLLVKGDVIEARTKPSVALDVDLQNASDATLRALLGSRPSRETGSPLPIWLRGRLSGDERALAFAAETLALGQTELTGDIAVRLDGPKPFVTAALKSPHVAAPERGAASDAELGSTGERSARKDTSVGNKPSKRDAAPDAPARWSREPFDLTALNRVDGEFKLEAERLSLGSWIAESVSTEATLKNGVLDLSRMDGRLFDGTLTGQAVISGGEQPDYAVTFNLAGADIDALLRAVGSADAATGRVSLEGNLTAAGASEFAIVSSLDGNVVVHAEDGTIEGVDLGSIGSGLTQLTVAKDFTGIARAGLSEGSTRIETLDGTVRFDNGVGRTDDMRAIADGGVGTITGAADLPRWHLDMTASFTLDEPPGVPPLGVRLVGPIDRPERQFEIDSIVALVGEQLKQRLLDDERINIKLRKGAKGEPGTVTDQVLRNVFGDADEAQPPLEATPVTPPPSEAAPVTPAPLEAAPPSPAPQEAVPPSAPPPEATPPPEQPPAAPPPEPVPAVGTPPPAPEPQSAPAPAPAPEPAPVPEPAPAPEPVPEPAPAPEPTPEQLVPSPEEPAPAQAPEERALESQAESAPQVDEAVEPPPVEMPPEEPPPGPEPPTLNELLEKVLPEPQEEGLAN